MNSRTEYGTDRDPNHLGRRDFLTAAMVIAAAAMLPAMSSAKSVTSTNALPRRKLGALEVSAIGLGCMNMAWGFGPPIDKRKAFN